MSKENIVNNILGSIDLMITERIKGLQFDKTVICSIIDDSKKQNGIYKVSDGSISFEAYSESDKYKVGDSVRVAIDNGDMTAEKFIIGKYVTSDNIQPITYVSPLEQICIIKDAITNIRPGDVYGLIANSAGYKQSPEKTATPLCKVEFKDDEYSQLKVSGLYDTFYLQAEFKTLFNDYALISGEYGIRADFNITATDGTTSTKSLYLTSKDMFGDPYNFGIYTLQTQIFDLSNIDNVKSIDFYFYQDNNFSEGGNTGIGIAEEANILMKSMKAGFGVHSSDFEDNTLKIYTNGSLTYQKEQSSESYLNKRHISLTWYNKDDNGKYVGFDDGEFYKTNAFEEEEIVKNEPNNGEYTYLKVNKAQQRLIDGMADETILQNDIGLTINANLVEAKSLFDKLYGLVNSDLCSLVSDLKRKVQNTFDTGNNIYNTLKEQAEEIKTIADESWEYIKNALAGAAYAVRDRKLIGSEEDPAPQVSSPSTPYYGARLITAYDKIIAQTNSIKEITETESSSYKGIYDNYFKKIEDIVNQINQLKAGISEYYYVKKNNFYLEQWAWIVYSATADGEYPYEKYNPTPLSKYDNKYSIYWYRYDPEQRLGTEHLDYNDSNAIQGYGRVKNGYEAKSIDINLNAEHMIEEKIYAILFYNHEKYKSNIITFTNNTPISNTANNALSNKIEIEHDEYSNSTYQLYGENNFLINSTEQYKTRKVKVQYYNKNGILNNEALQGAQVYWHIPQNNTMIQYNDQDFLVGYDSETEEPIYEFLKITDSDSPYGLDGYTTFYKNNLNEDFYFSYRIKDYYMASATQNHILCKVVKDEYEYDGRIDFTFSSFGTSGTDYTLKISPVGNQSAVLPNKGLQFTFDLYDYNNALIDYSSNTSWSLDINISGENYVYDKNTQTVTYQGPDYYGILTAKLSCIMDGKAIQLTSYYPLAYASANYFLEGAKTIIYNSNGGSEPAYYKQEYKLYYLDNEQGLIEYPSALDYYIENPYNESEEYNILKAYYPQIIDKKISPCAIFIQDSLIQPVVMVADPNKNSEVIYYQSIYIGQNRYPSAMLNAWDGELTIDEKNGTILSAMVGAGRKTVNNTFEGILMGDIKAGAEFNPEEEKSGLGLYGFNDGAQSFGFNIDGTAFLGKSGRGRIKFDGNSGTITSASYELSHSAGMKIDLDDGLIDIVGASISTNADGVKDYQPLNSSVRISVEDPYFKIMSAHNNPLIEIGQDEYFLQTDNFGGNDVSDNALIYDEDGIKLNRQNDNGQIVDVGFNSEKIGTRIDLMTGKIESYDFTINAYNGKQSILLSSSAEKYPFNINDVFTIDWSGSVFASAGTIGKDTASGQLYIANQQKIGGSSDDEDLFISHYTSSSTYFQRGDSKDLNLSEIGQGVANNNFYLGAGGLIMRPADNNKQFIGLRLTPSWLLIEGHPLFEDSTFTKYTGSGVVYYTKQQNGIDTNDTSILFDTNLVENNIKIKKLGSVGIEQNENEEGEIVKELSITSASLPIRIESNVKGSSLTFRNGSTFNLDKTEINLSGNNLLKGIGDGAVLRIPYINRPEAKNITLDIDPYYVQNLKLSETKTLGWALETLADDCAELGVMIYQADSKIRSLESQVKWLEKQINDLKKNSNNSGNITA